MNYYSTNRKARPASLKDAVIRGLAEDGGLYMPEHLPVLTGQFLLELRDLPFPEVAQRIAGRLFAGDVPGRELEEITSQAISFDTPLVKVRDRIYSLELFHGPTLAFKDVGARFMARLLGYFVQGLGRQVHVLVATSGDTGSAAASGFFRVPGIKVHILYPSGLVSRIQEKQFTTLGENITALEVRGSFDDCQYLVKQAFGDAEIRKHLFLTSANSINLARLLPQTFYYFNILAGLKDHTGRLVICVPSGNFGNLTAGLIAWKMGLPANAFVAATNINDVVPGYLDTGVFTPRESVPTLANAMDVGNPGNFARVLDLFGGNWNAIRNLISGEVTTDEQIMETIAETWEKHGYMLEPHGATGYRSLSRHMQPGDTGVFLATAHPAKFMETVEQATGQAVEVPGRLAEYLEKPGRSIPLSSNYDDFRDYLMQESADPS